MLPRVVAALLRRRTNRAPRRRPVPLSHGVVPQDSSEDVDHMPPARRRDRVLVEHYLSQLRSDAGWGAASPGSARTWVTGPTPQGLRALDRSASATQPGAGTAARAVVDDR